MGNSIIPVIKFMFQTNWKPFSEVLGIQPSFEVKSCSVASDIPNHLSNASAVLILTAVSQKNDLLQLATLIKMTKAWPKELVYKIVVVNFINDKQFDKAIAKLGIQDLIDVTISSKALKFKMDFWMKSLVAQVKGNSSNELVQKSLKTSDGSKVNEVKGGSTAPNWIKSLDSENDIWILKNEGDCKKILTKWLIKLRGPSPYVSTWTEISPEVWRLDFKDFDRKNFIPGNGHWYFQGGNKPDFYWSENIWVFSGENFDLFYKENDQHLSRIASIKRIFTICENSKIAENKSKIILESCDKDIVFKKEADYLSNLKGEVNGAVDNLENLSGKNKTEKISANPLSGSVKGTDTISSDPLSMDLKTNEEKKSNPLLVQKTQTQREATHWKGKNAYEQPGKVDPTSPASGKLTEGTSLELENKNNEHQKYYKGHNPAESFDTSKEEKKQNHAKSEQIDGHLRGKQNGASERNKDLAGENSTDKLSSFYDNNSEKKKNENEDKTNSKVPRNHPENKSEAKADTNPGLHPLKLNKRTQKDTVEKKTDDLASLADKSENDQSSREENKELAGESHTEKLDSHYRNTNSNKIETDKTNAQNSHSSKTNVFRKTTSDPASLADKSANDQSSIEEGKDITGKTHTEKLDSHYKNTNSNKIETDKTNTQNSHSSKTNVFRKATPDPVHSKEQKQSANDNPNKRKPDVETSLQTAENSAKKSAPDFSRDNQDQRSEIGDRNKNGINKLANTSKVDLDVQNSKTNLFREETSTANLNKDQNRSDEESAALTNSSKTLDRTNVTVNDDKSKNPKKSKEVQTESSAEVFSIEKAREAKSKEDNGPASLADEDLHMMAASAKVTACLKQDMMTLNCGLDDYFDETLIFHTDKKCFKLNSEVKVVINFDYFNKIETLKINGMILQEDEEEAGLVYVTVQLNKENIKHFEKFMTHFKSRQSNVDAFLKSVKGL